MAGMLLWGWQGMEAKAEVTVLLLAAAGLVTFGGILRRHSKIHL